MKIQGIDLNTPRVETLVIPRGETNIVFKAQAVLDLNDFDKICPTPEAPERHFPGGKTGLALDDPQYLKEMDEWSTRKWYWTCLKSLEATENLEWDSVDMSDPSTYENFEEELTKAGFSQLEKQRIVQLIITACGLNQTKIDEATESFLAGEQEAQNA